jgi:carboxyl-terminal processing protease
MRARTPCALLLLLCAAPGLSGALRAQSADTVPAAVRERVATELDRTIRRSFAHWEGAPGLDYPAAFRAYRERVAATADRREFDLATLEFVASLRNGHTDFSDRWLWERHGAPTGFLLSWLDGRWIVSQSTVAGLAAGDEVAAIDGEPFEAFFRRQARYVSASSERWARRMLSRRPYLFPERFTLTLAGGRRVEVERRSPAAQAAPASPAAGADDGAVPHRWLAPDSVAYLWIPYFGEAKYQDRALELLRTRYRGAPAMVLDLRGNGGGSTPWKLRKALGGRRFKVLRDNARPSLLERLLVPVALRAYRAPRYRGRLVVLVNGGCFSACEDLAGSLKGGAATLVGDTTGGSTGQPVFLELGDGMTARVSARRYALPDGTPFEGVGVAPDVVVQATPESLRAGSDPALERALALARAAVR